MRRKILLLAVCCWHASIFAANPDLITAAPADVCAPTAGSFTGATTAPAVEPAWSQRLMDALTTTTNDRAQQLARALDRVPAAAGRDPLVVRAQLTLAALILGQTRVTDARDVLRRIPTDTEAALDAGLLMAETYAIDGDVAEAVRWNLRILQRWPDEPAALAALIQRAGALGETDRPTAIAALGNARGRAQDAADKLRALSLQLGQDHWFAQWVDDGREPVLDSTMVALFYRTLASSAFRAARSTALATQDMAWCAREQLARLERMRQDLARLEAEARATLVPLESRRAEMQAKYEALHAHYLSRHEQDVALGRQVNALRNALAREAVEITTLHGALAALPAANQRLAAEAGRLRQVTVQVGALARNEVVAILRAVVVEREAMLRDLAGTASLGVGELQDPLYRKAAR